MHHRLAQLVLTSGLLSGGMACAQDNCMLVPVPLTERLSRASWAVEAQASAPQVVRDARGHLLTRYGLTVFKVFREPKVRALVPATVLLAGGALGARREEVSSAPRLVPGQQGVFFLEPDPQHFGEWRLYAGPQGLVTYNLTDRTAADPFAAYPTIKTGLYPALRNPAEASGYRLVRSNTALTAPVPVRRPGTVADVTGFSPTTVAAGTGTVLTITGSGFGAIQSTGTVQFANANDGGNSRVRPLATDYLIWTDVQIQVRVPSTTLEGRSAGTGPVTVVNSAGAMSASTTALDIRYAVYNIAIGTPSTAHRTKLIDTNGAGGYTLSYAPSMQANTLARGAFERSNTQWTCKTQVNRITGQTGVPTGAAADGINIVTFDATPATLPAGVLGTTYSYYRTCVDNVTLRETDMVFANRSDWNFGPQAPTTAEFDFESVALHELGHGVQLAHVINPAAVMHYSINNGQSHRVLDAIDLPGGRDEVQFSSTPNSAVCGPAPAPHVLLTLTGCNQLPVELIEFVGHYEAGRGARLRWATASERASAYFVVEAQEERAATWTVVGRRAAAGASSARRDYNARDPRLLTGTRYYRLRQVDLDGQANYSPVVAVTGRDAGLALYPDPTGDQLQVSGPAGPGQLTLYDLAGRVVARFALESGPAEVDLRGLPPGLYTVEWTDGQTVRRGRVQKL